ncbi:hypothetical protein C8Q80DRAFT_1208481 [Daedaleopsis nitida]|nr:hypothetical protein C8Q80DRAFT_1208481 [Daedaleopsis nitida]
MDDRRDKTRDIAIAQYASSWNDYYEWEPTYCAEIISSLRVSDTPGRSSDAMDIDAPAATLDATVDGRHALLPTTSSDTQDTVTVYHNLDSPDDMRVTELTYEDIDLSNMTPLAPYPPYESCTPVSRNILHGDDPNSMAFLPLADDPDFDKEFYLSTHKSLAWQEPYRDSDALEIVLETARRLHYEHGLSMEEIDETGVLPLTLCTRSVVGGAIAMGKTNDPIPWPGSSRTRYPPLPDLSPPEPHDLVSRVRDLVALWCPDPGCVQANCFTHVNGHVMPDYTAREPLQCLSPDESCGERCIVEHPNALEGEVKWSDADLDELRLLCYLSGPTQPCNLAKVSLKTCYEIAVICKRFAKSQNSEVSDTLETGSTALGCQCGMALPGRKKRNVVSACLTNLCPCRKARRECDPKLCSSCIPKCENTNLQRGLFKSTEVRESNHGMGLFLAEPVKRGQLVIEYLGELIYEPTVDSRSAVSACLKRSYIFDMLKSNSGKTCECVDGMYVGNPSRFINHSAKANVIVHIMSVGGDQRIGIYASELRSPLPSSKSFHFRALAKNMDAGTELLMDYGPDFPIGE